MVWARKSRRFETIEIWRLDGMCCTSRLLGKLGGTNVLVPGCLEILLSFSKVNRFIGHGITRL